MLFKIYTKKFVPRNIQYTGTWDNLTYETYDVNIKHVTQNVITCQTDRIFYYAFSKNPKFATKADSWRTISIRYLSNTTYELTLKQINAVTRNLQSQIYLKTNSYFPLLKNVETLDKNRMWQSFQTRQAFGELTDKARSLMTCKEVEFLGIERGIYIQMAQDPSGEKTFSGKNYKIRSNPEGSASDPGFSVFVYKTEQDRISTGIYTFFLPFNDDNLSQMPFILAFLHDLSGEELFISAFIGMKPNAGDITTQGFYVYSKQANTPVLIAQGVSLNQYNFTQKSGYDLDLSGYCGNSIHGILNIAGENLTLFSSRLNVLPIITAGKCLLSLTTCLPKSAISAQIPYKEFKKIYESNNIIVDVFSTTQLSKINLSDYYSNPYAQKQIDFQKASAIFDYVYSAATSTADAALTKNLLTPIFSGAKAGKKLTGNIINVKSTEYKARATYNSASVSDFGDLTKYIQNMQKAYIYLLPELSSENAKYMQSLAEVELIEEIMKSFEPIPLKQVTGDSIRLGSKILYTSAITFSSQNVSSILGFIKGELASYIHDNDIVDACEYTEEDTQTVREGLWLISGFADLQNLINQI